MPSLSRRALLWGVAASAALLVGCQRDSGSDSRASGDRGRNMGKGTVGSEQTAGDRTGGGARANNDNPTRGDTGADRAGDPARNAAPKTPIDLSPAPATRPTTAPASPTTRPVSGG